MRKTLSKSILFTIGMVFYFFSFNAQQCIYTIGGTGATGFSGDGGPATIATMFAPRGMTVDNAGNVYFIDAINSRIRKITPSGIISTVAGCGLNGFSGDGGPATSAKLWSPDGLAIDAAGNLYISDMQNSRIRKVNTVGIISTIAGNGTIGYGGDGGPASTATLGGPNGMDIDASGNIYFYDRVTSRIRKINTSGIITTVAGNGTIGFSGDGGPATSASIGNAYGVAVDGSGNIYIAESANNRIRKVNTSGIINTIAGTGTAGFSGDGGAATSAQINNPFGISVDGTGNVYFCDNLNRRIRQINTSGIINTVVGTGVFWYNGDGIPSTAAQLDPLFMAFDASYDMYISDYNNERIRKITSAIPLMPINTTPSVNLNICAGNSTTVSATGTAILGWYSSSTGGVYLGGGNILNTSTLSTNTTFYVQDSSACAVSPRQAITVTVNPIPNITVNSGSICAGQSFTIVPGGASTYTYSGGSSVVSPSATTSYSVSGTSAAGCISTTVAVSNVTVNALPMITATSNPTIVCIGQSALLNGGGALTYSWSTGAATTSTSVTPGITTTYSLNGSDINGCENSTTLTVAVSNPQLSLTTTSITCFGSCNGSITSSISGGIAPYTFTPSSITNVCAGTFTVYATDNIGCTTFSSAIITQPAALLISANVQSVACNGACTGGFTLSPTGGTAPYTYTPFPLMNSLCAGPINYTVTDANNCTRTSSFTIVQPAPFNANIALSNSVVCSGTSATLTANYSGGTPPVTFLWNTTAISQSIAVNPSITTIYTSTLTDNNGCTKTVTQTLSTIPNPTVTAATSASVICMGQTSTLTSNGALTYSWSTSATGSTTAVSPTINTAYTVTGTDANGCINTDTITQYVSDCTGINERAGNLNFQLYPNPTSGDLILKTEQKENLNIEIYNPIGQLILKQNITEPETKIDLKEKANGVYFVTIHSLNGSVTKKLVKE